MKHRTSPALRSPELETVVAVGSAEREPLGTRPRVRVDEGGMDLFLRDVYDHFRFRGLLNVVASKSLNALTVPFLGLVYTVLAHRVNYLFLSGADPSGSLFRPAPARYPAVTWVVWSVLAVLLAMRVLSLAVSVVTHYRIMKFYSTWLSIPQSALETAKWSAVVDRIAGLRNFAAGDAPLSQIDVVSRIMRRENYLISLLNLGALDLAPFRGGTPLVTETVEWALWLSIFSVNWGPSGIRDTAMESERWARELRKRFYLVGIMFLVFSPVILVALMVYVLLRYGELARENPGGLLASRKWSPHARWCLREINEVHHLFDARLRKAYLPAREYVDLFPSSSTLAVVARPAILIVGALFLSILGLSFLTPNFVFHIWGTSSVLFMTVLAAVLGFLRGLLPKEAVPADPEEALKAVVRHTHFFPSKWHGRAHTNEVLADFCSLFDLKIFVWLRESRSVLLLPYLCFLTLPRCADRVVSALKTFTVFNPAVGNVCSFSSLVDPRHGNCKYGSAESAPKHMRLRNGKMEKSFLNFYLNYPSWELPSEGREILQRLKDFEESERSRRAMARSQLASSNAFMFFGNGNQDNPEAASACFDCNTGPVPTDVVDSIMLVSATASARRELAMSMAQMSFYDAHKTQARRRLNRQDGRTSSEEGAATTTSSGNLPPNPPPSPLVSEPPAVKPIVLPDIVSVQSPVPGESLTPPTAATPVVGAAAPKSPMSPTGAALLRQSTDSLRLSTDNATVRLPVFSPDLAFASAPDQSRR